VPTPPPCRPKNRKYQTNPFSSPNPNKTQPLVPFGHKPIAAPWSRPPACHATYLSPHGRSIYVQDAQSPENLLAFAMNGKPRPPEHGFPLRLVMPGWYGMAQVKWLTRIEVIDRRYEGRHMARNDQSLRAVNARGEIQPTREELRDRVIGNREDNSQWPRSLVI